MLAFSPQFAVSPHEAPYDPNRHAFYNAALHGDMAITDADVAGRTSVFYDPAEQMDRLHAQAIQTAVPTVNLVPVMYTGHHLIRIFADEPRLARAVRATLTGVIARFVR